MIIFPKAASKKRRTSAEVLIIWATVLGVTRPNQINCGNIAVFRRAVVSDYFRG